MKTLISGVVCGAALVALSACSDVQGKTETPLKPVRVAAAQEIREPARLRYSATIQASANVPVAFRASGAVDYIAQRRGADGRQRWLQAGDMVRAGEVLARVREADYRQRVNQAAASLRELDAARVKAQLDLERARTLFEAESLTKPDLDAAQAAFDASEARIASAQAQAALADIALRDGVMTSPISGVIVERRIETGALVSPGGVGFAIAQVSPVKAVFGVPDLHVPAVSFGRPLTVTTEAFPESAFDGTVTGIAPSADSQSRLFTIEVSLPNADGRLRPGMIGAVDLSAASPAATASIGIGVPLSAVVRAASGTSYAVFVAEGDGDHRTARSRPVTLGDVRGNAVAVTGGLRDGEQVIVSGPGLLVDGERVRIVP